MATDPKLFNPYRTQTVPGEWVEGFKEDTIHDALTKNPAPKGPPLMVLGSEASSQVSVGSTSDSNKPDTVSPGSVRRTSGGEVSSQPASQESNAASTWHAWDDYNQTDTGEITPTLTIASGLGIPKAQWIFSAEASPVKTSLSPAAEPDSSAASDRASSSSAPASQMSFYDQELGSSLRTYPDSFPLTVAEISVSFSRRWPTSGSTTSLGECWTHDSSESPSDGGVSSSLRDVLEDAVPERYFLSPRAAAGILRRAEKRGRELPPHLLSALRMVADTASTPSRPRGAS